MADTYSEEELDALRTVCPGVASAEEAGAVIFWLPQLILPAECTPSKVDALLCPSGRDGYPSRLYFAQQVSSRQPRNWNGIWHVLEKDWHAFSWKVSAENLTLVQILLEHLEGLK